MLNLTRSLVLAAGVAILAPAHATLVTLDFSNLVAAGPGKTAPLGTYGSAFDLVFGGGALANYASVGDPGCTASTDPLCQNLFGLGTFTLSLVQSPKLYSGFDTLVLDLRYLGTLSIFATNKVGDKVGGFQQTCTSGPCTTTWSTDVAITLSDVATELTFFDPSSVFVDNIRLGMTSLAPSTVPEPASFGLVALALGGAAFASRRRRT